jgi:ribosomal protein L30E
MLSHCGIPPFEGNNVDLRKIPLVLRMTVVDAAESEILKMIKEKAPE